MAVDNTGVATAARCASLALDLLAQVIAVSNPPQQQERITAARRESENLLRAAAEDIAAYNRYLIGRELGDAIEVPMRALRSAVAGIELCTAMVTEVKASVAADLGVARALLQGAVRGIGLCLAANLRSAGDDERYAPWRTEWRDLEDRARLKA
jgi:hypothetical protein